MKLKNLLTTIILHEFEGHTPEGKDFQRLVNIFWETLPPRCKLDRQVLEDSLRHCAGQLLTRDVIVDTCWRMAGNVPRLQEDRAVPPWSFQRVPEWVPVQLVAMEPARNRRKEEAGFRAYFRVMGGTPCPMVLNDWWSRARCGVFATRCKFSGPASPRARNPARYPYSYPTQLVNMRFYALVCAEAGRQGPAVVDYHWTNHVAVHNREMVKRRLRVDPGYGCVLGFDNTFACHNCPAGYARKELGGTPCPAATHKLVWVPRPCPQCQREDAFFDPEFESTVCVDCRVRNSFRKEE